MIALIMIANCDLYHDRGDGSRGLFYFDFGEKTVGTVLVASSFKF
jgi:hypothetical protein